MTPPCHASLSGPSGSLPPLLCAGYGQLDQQQWPHWAAAAVSPSSFLSANGIRHPLLGCGACLELRCDPRPGFEVWKAMI